MKFRRVAAYLGLSIMASPALAHQGAGLTASLPAGLLHPLSGLDHVLVMAAIGMWAAALGGRAIWAVPTAFVAMMAAGAIFGAQVASPPLIEAGIVLSVIAMGALVAFRIEMPMAASMAVAGLFALFHGHAHGAEMAIGTSSLSYGIGFCIATALLHGIGIALGLLARPSLQRWIGAAVSVAGIALLGLS